MTERDDLTTADSSEADDAVPASSPALYGRAAELEAILTSRAPVLVLTGDSGIGKSELLRAAQRTTASVAAPPPRTVRGTSGSLQRALLDSLSEATADLVRERGLAQQVGERLVAAAKKLVTDKGTEAAKVIVRAILLKVKEKVGDDAVDLMAEYARDLGEAGHETLLARLNAATDEDVADTILNLAGQVADLAGSETPIVIALDGAELLPDNDRRLLADLSTRLPEGVFVRVAFGTFSEEHLAHVEDLLAVGETVREQPVRRLSLAAIREWLEAEGLDSARAQDLYDNTDGYALDVGDAIQQLASGGALEDVEPSQKFKMRSLQAWRALDNDTQAVARQLAVFEQPLPEEWLQQACDLTPAEWGVAVEKLRRARILSSFVNGVPWFHPRRRQAIVDQLRESERVQLQTAAGRAISAYLGYATAAAEPQVAADIATLAVDAPALLEADAAVSAALKLDQQELAVAAAVIDAFEPRSHPPLANHVLQHARDFFAGHGDLIHAVESLIEAGLVVSDGDEGVGGLLRPNFGSETAQAVVQGRALRELGRLPLPGLVSSVFDMALAPRLQPFMNAVYGLGLGSMRTHVETADALGRVPLGTFLARGQGHFLILTARFHERPISATVRFASSEQLESARSRLLGMRLDVLGGALEITEGLVHPDDAIAADRFVGAVDRALGRQLNRTQNLRLQMERPYDPDTYMELRVATFRLLAGRCTDAERRVIGLDQVPSIHWHLNAAGDALVQGEAYGGEPRAVRHDNVPAMNAADPLMFFRYAEAFGLAEGERLLRINHSGGRPMAKDPVLQVIEELRKKARAVTRHQARLQVAVDAPTLESRLLEARTRELGDARALAANGPLDGHQMPEPGAHAAYACIHRTARRGIGAGLSFGCLLTTSPSGVEEVHVTNEPAPGSGSPEEMLRMYGELFGTELRGEVVNASAGDATRGIADLLGYHEDDIVLVDSDGHPADVW